MDKDLRKEAEAILKKFQEGTASQEEMLLIQDWFEHTTIFDKKENLSKIDEDQLFAKIKTQIRDRRRKADVLKIWKYSAAVAVILLSLAPVLYFQILALAKYEDSHQVLLNDALPGQNVALLELSNGEQVKLTEGNGVKLLASGVKIDEVNGIVSFHTDKNKLTQDVLGEKVKLSTKAGGQYTVILPDSSLAKLNANSSIQFSRQFDNKRLIDVEGEVYFNVQRDEKKKFVVYAGHQYIEVLGTQFNIKAYKEEQETSTALISGSLLVASTTDHDKSYHVLKPGQVAKNGPNKSLTVSSTVIEKECAFQKGEFYFDGESLEEILTILSRWYDVKFKYEFTPSEEIRYGGVISRDKNLSTVLKLLEDRERIQFSIRGKEVIVRKRVN